MGVNLRDILIFQEKELDDFKGKIIAIDSYNMLYQFLASIRTMDGQLLTDGKGRVTSHIIGLFSRTTNFLAKGIRPIFVFDGKAPELKAKEIHRRFEAKQEAKKKYQQAVATEDVESMKKYAARFIYLTPEMVSEAKELVRLLGLPIVQAPSEGEAQASHIVTNGDAWAVGSQDYDSLLYATPRLLQNLSIAGRKKKIHGMGTRIVMPSMIDLAQNLSNLKIDQDRLIALAMLIGTDYNPGGIHGIGPKKALKLVQQHTKVEQIFKAVEWEKHTTTPWQEIFDLFKKMPVTDDYKIKWGSPDVKGINEFLVNERGFSEERVIKGLEPLKKQQSGLGNWL